MRFKVPHYSQLRTYICTVFEWRYVHKYVSRPFVCWQLTTLRPTQQDNAHSHAYNRLDIGFLRDCPQVEVQHCGIRLFSRGLIQHSRAKLILPTIWTAHLQVINRFICSWREWHTGCNACTVITTKACAC